MRSALTLSTVLIVLATSGAAVAQERLTSRPPEGSNGLRYLSWPGKPPVGGPAVPARRAPSALPLARLAPVAPAAATPPPVSTSRQGLTPASAWTAPALIQPVRPEPARAEAPRPDPAPPPPPPAPSSAPVAAPAPAPASASEPAPAYDPMAPRQDAPIFRLGRASAQVRSATPQSQSQPHPQTQPQVQAEGQAYTPAPAPSLGARFYSVHRQAGRQPDPIPAAQPVYLDALPVEMAQTPASADLAQPDAPPALIRNSNGTLRAVPQTGPVEAGSLPPGAGDLS